MPEEITKEDVRRLMQGGAQLVEALSANAYQKIHIQGAISLPLYEMDRETVRGKLERGRPVITYCANYT